MTFCLQNGRLRSCVTSRAVRDQRRRARAWSVSRHAGSCSTSASAIARRGAPPRLGQQPPDPARGGSIKPRVIGLCENGEDRQRIVKPDGRQLGRDRLDDLQVARHQGALQAAVR